jgi:hypothetical protein
MVSGSRVKFYLISVCIKFISFTHVFNTFNLVTEKFNLGKGNVECNDNDYLYVCILFLLKILVVFSMYI